MAEASVRLMVSKHSRAPWKASTLAVEFLIPEDIWLMQTAISTRMKAKTAQATSSSTRVKAC